MEKDTYTTQTKKDMKKIIKEGLDILLGIIALSILTIIILAIICKAH